MPLPCYWTMGMREKKNHTLFHKQVCTKAVKLTAMFTRYRPSILLLFTSWIFFPGIYAKSLRMLKYLRTIPHMRRTHKLYRERLVKASSWTSTTMWPSGSGSIINLQFKGLILAKISESCSNIVYRDRHSLLLHCYKQIGYMGQHVTAPCHWFTPGVDLTSCLWRCSGGKNCWRSIWSSLFDLFVSLSTVSTEHSWDLSAANIPPSHSGTYWSH